MSTRNSFAFRLAYAHARRTLRHYKRMQKFVGAVILPEGSDTNAWDLAFNDVITNYDHDNVEKRTYGQRSHCAVALPSKALQTYKLDRPERLPYLYIIPDNHRSAFRDCPQASSLDFVEEVTLDVKTTAYCVKAHTQQSLTAAQVVDLLALTDDARELIVRKGRPIADRLDRFKLVGTTTPKSEEKPSGPKLSELSGYGEAKDWGMELARDIADYRDGTISWDDVDAGLLLSGPPGTGKTTYAAALARECGVGFVAGSFAKWQANGALGDTLKAMAATFKKAREVAPCILLIDEVDNFVDRESDKSDNSYMRSVVNAFLEELDGSESLEGVVVVGACNHPDRIDPAVVRSGRLDRHIAIELPDRDARVDILFHHLRGEVDKLKLGLTSRQTAGLSGADLERVARDARRLARRERVPVSVKHVARCLPKLEDVPQDYIRYTALHEAGHAVIACVLESGVVDNVSVLHRRRPGEQIAGGCTLEFGGYKRNTREEIEDRICVFLGGMAVEQLVYGSHGNGSFDDLQNATTHAVRMTMCFGMNGRMISMMKNDSDIQRLIENDVTLQEDVDAVLSNQLVRAKQIVAENMDAVRTVAAELEEREVVLGSLVSKIVEDCKRKHTRAMTM